LVALLARHSSSRTGGRGAGRRSFGDVGFYRIQRTRDGRLRVWRIRTLKEVFRLYVDPEGELRCDHSIRFLGLPVLRIHYRIEPKRGLEV
jgi:hypothetical protein